MPAGKNSQQRSAHAAAHTVAGAPLGSACIPHQVGAHTLTTTTVHCKTDRLRRAAHGSPLKTWFLHQQTAARSNYCAVVRSMLRFTCSLSCSSSPRGRWKMTVTGGLESLAARCQRATVHGLTVQRADVAMVQACLGRRRCSRRRVARCRLSCSSRCSSSPRGRWKMTVTGGLESLAARCQRATVHDLTAQSVAWRISKRSNLKMASKPSKVMPQNCQNSSAAERSMSQNTL